MSVRRAPIARRRARAGGGRGHPGRARGPSRVARFTIKWYAAQRSDDWIAVAVELDGTERRARAVDPVAALDALLVTIGVSATRDAARDKAPRMVDCSKVRAYASHPACA